VSKEILKRKFQFTDLDDNTNKYWQITVFDDGWLQTEYGRVGVVNKPSRKRGGVQDADKIIRKKLRDGYKELTLHVPDVVVGKKSTATLSASVKSFVDMVMQEAGQQTSGYLSVPINELAQSQLDDALKVLQEIQRLKNLNAPLDKFIDLTQTYYTLVPTKLPARINKIDVTTELAANITEQEQRLLQLSAALSSHKAAASGGDGLEVLGGLKLVPAVRGGEKWEAIEDHIKHTIGYHTYVVDDVLEVEIPTERKAYDDNDFGKHKTATVFHGTDNFNLQYIMRGGLIVPRVSSHGRYYGDGIYFSPQSQKSLNYTGGRTHTRTLLICEVAMGERQVAPGTGCRYRTQPDAGYHSIVSPYTPSGLDEYIVYNNNQVTIRAVARMRRS